MPKRKQTSENSESKKAREEKIEENQEEREEEAKTEKSDGMLRIVSFNVAGLTACVKKEFCENMKKINADIICLQETKASFTQFESKGRLVLTNYIREKALFSCDKAFIDVPQEAPAN